VEQAELWYAGAEGAVAELAAFPAALAAVAALQRAGAAWASVGECDGAREVETHAAVGDEALATILSAVPAATEPGAQVRVCVCVETAASGGGAEAAFTAAVVRSVLFSVTRAAAHGPLVRRAVNPDMPELRGTAGPTRRDAANRALVSAGANLERVRAEQAAVAAMA
jgi:hypothetical protein